VFDERRRWDRLTAGGMDVFTISGTHEGETSFLAEPRVVDVAAAVERFLREGTDG
jgi:hypothetical protein